MKNQEDSWDTVIDPDNSIGLGLSKILQFRDLLFLLVKRDLITIYKQTVLGPIWLILQPILTAITFTIIFGRVAQLSTDETPQFLFYYSGVVVWSFFSECVMKVSDTFNTNADLFSKVFFPRLIVPLSIVITSFIKMLINFTIFLCILGVYIYSGYNVNFQIIELFFLLVVFFVPAILGLSIGLIITSLTAKYKDLRFFLQFGIQLLLYMSPVIYPLSMLSGKFKTIISFNPLVSPIECMRNVFFNKSGYSFELIIYSLCIGVVLFILGLLIFNRTERSFIDTV